MSRSAIPAKRGGDAQEAAWVADEDRFVLRQARRKAAIRVKNGRAQPIDWLTVILAVVDPERNSLDDEIEDGDLEIIDPQALFDELDDEALEQLEKKIGTFETLETSRSNRSYWTMMKTICHDKRTHPPGQTFKGVSSVMPDMDKLLASKTVAELEKLESQINRKLNSDDPIDVDYWENLLAALLTYKARARLADISKLIVTARSARLRQEQTTEAERLKQRLAMTEPERRTMTDAAQMPEIEPFLRLRPEDKVLRLVDLAAYNEELTAERQAVLKNGYMPAISRGDKDTRAVAKRIRNEQDAHSMSVAAFDREVARGLGDNEEIFNAEVDVVTKNKHLWVSRYRPRKPQSFNRVSLGFEWNKYNQTHYDQDNPPPKVVQGYKFNIFYPDLADKSRAPTYRIEREDGRRRGESTAPAGEDDTCVIHFIAGPPYEDIAFRIVDKEWDYSAKRERGFRSSFDKGVLQLQFQFKKIYYRK